MTLPLDWANESFQIARKADVQYCVMVGDTCQYSADAAQLTANMPRAVAPTIDYNEAFAATITERLQAAGIRLGAVLNEIAAVRRTKRSEDQRPSGSLTSGLRVIRSGWDAGFLCCALATNHEAALL